MFRLDDRRRHGGLCGQWRPQQLGQASPPQPLRRQRKKTPTRTTKHNNNNNNKDKDPADKLKTASPIKHVIILIGENRGLDHTFGVYKPKGKNQTIANLLSKGIVNEDGTPGPNFTQAQQFAVAGQPSFYIGAPTIAKSPYNPANLMPQPNTEGTPAAQSDTSPPFKTIAEASVEKDMDPADLDILTTGATLLPANSLDTRVPGAGALAGPFALQGPILNDDDYTGDTTHRFYQDWQQEDCSAASANKKTNNSGCLNDLFPFVMATYSATNKSLGNSMGFYNAEQEQAPILKMLADRFTLSDNFHQSFHGGTGANHFMLGTGDAAFWSDGKGNPTTPPSTLIANPNPKAGTINTYTVDGNWSNCSDIFQPGVQPIVSYLEPSALRGGAELQAQPLLHAQQRQSGLPPERCVVGWKQRAAVARPDDR